MTARRSFGSTYRFQLNGFGFAAVRDLVPFLADLGIQTIYLSPVTQARTGSTHGYDVADFAVVDPSLGGRAGYDALLAAAGEHDMTVLLDIVPNHMSASTDNPYFADVLRHGEASEFAAYFDIQWSEQDGRILLPVLGASLEDAIAAGEVTVDATDAAAPQLTYFEHRFPLDPTTVEQPIDKYDDASRLRTLVDRQHYRLVDWHRANAEVNYRRFFDINELIGIRQEDPAVFEATHRLIAELVDDPRCAGVRVDHVDGVRDPAGYLAALRQLLGPEPVIEIEKILERDELLRTWPVDGTSGYEFAVATTGVFIDAAGAAELRADAAKATNDTRSFADRGLAAKRLVVETRFPHLVEQIADLLADALPEHERADLLTATAALSVQLSTYRTYRVAGDPVDPADRETLRTAATASRAALSPAAAAALDDVVAAFTADPMTVAATEAVARWQQLTPPTMAKGVEDTAMYDPGWLLASADVGGAPDQAAVAVAEWHATMAARQRSWPVAMSTLSTHDSKRSQDVRCRLAVLSEIPEQWARAVATIEDLVTDWCGDDGPDVIERRYLYETLVGAWPIAGGLNDDFAQRIREHLVKAGREAKRRSDWIRPDVDHEAAVGSFVDRLLRGDDLRPRAVVSSIVDTVAVAGATNSLAAVALRAVSPGVPDVYQNDDAWFFALVDPDNRATLDAPGHQSLLASLPADTDHDEVAYLLQHWGDSGLKQYIVAASLRLRRRLQSFFDDASYVAVEVTGAHRDQVIAFSRETGDHAVVCVVPRLTHGLAGGGFPVGDQVWSDTAIAVDGRWIDRISGRQQEAADGAISVGSLLRGMPVALLERV